MEGDALSLPSFPNIGGTTSSSSTDSGDAVPPLGESLCLVDFAVDAGGGAEVFFKLAGHVGVVLKAAFVGDVGDGHLGVFEQFAGLGEAQVGEILVRRDAGGFLEDAIEGAL